MIRKDSAITNNRNNFPPSLRGKGRRRGIFLLFLLCTLCTLPLQAQRKEPHVITCERKIRQLKRAPDNSEFAKALYTLGYFARDNGMYDESSLLASLASSFYAQEADSLGKLLLPALTKSFSFKKEDMDRSEALTRDDNYAHSQLGNCISMASEGMMHNPHLRSYVEKTLKTAFLQYWTSGTKGMYAKAHFLLADYYRQEKKYAKAENSYREGIELGKKALSREELEEGINKLALVLIRREKYKAAEKQLRTIRQEDNAHRPTLGFEEVMCSRACLAVMKNDYVTAETLSRAALERFRRYLEPVLIYRRHTLINFLDCFSTLALCYERQNQIEKSLETYQQMNSCLIDIFGPYIPYYIDLDRQNLLSIFQPWYDNMQTFAYRHIRRPEMPAFMYANAQLMKQFFLTSPALYDKRFATMQSDGYIREIRKRQADLMLADDAMNVHLEGDYLPNILCNMRSLMLTREASTYLMEKIKPSYNCRTEWASVNRYMMDAEVMVEFILLHRPDNGARQYAALVFTKADKAPHFVPLCDEESLRAALNNPDLRNDFIVKHIWNPVKAHFGEKIYINLYPTGLMNTIAFAGVVDDENLYLANSYVLNYHLCAMDRPEKPITGMPDNRSALLIGGADFGLPPSRLENPVRGQGFHYLPSSRREVALIANILKEKGCTVQTLTGKQATEGAFRRLSDLDVSPYILHISTHGFYLPYDPNIRSKGLNQEGKSGYFDPLMRTGLALSGASTAWKDSASLSLPDDGLITAYEICGVSLMNTELVVLSACNTGLGEIRDGEGVYGLQRAFRSAGAKNMIMTLAEVPDKETAEFMSLFYQLWKGKTYKQGAFVKAQWEMMKKYPQEPEKWANFVLIE